MRQDHLRVGEGLDVVVCLNPLFEARIEFRCRSVVLPILRCVSEECYFLT